MAYRKTRKQPIVLTIAGYDPSSGAGVTADIKTIAAHGCYGVSCITALTVQSTRGVMGVEPISGKVITETLESLARDVNISAVKIGMLGSAAAAQAVAGFLRRFRAQVVVLDPVLRSSSGRELITPQAVAIMKRELLALATVITPNIDEAAELAGISIRRPEHLGRAAEHLHKLGARAVVITGGHLKSPVDLVSPRPGEQTLLRGAKVLTRSTHGTGCAFSSSLACNLAHGNTLEEAARAAKRFVESALRSAPAVGKGRGPVI
jgi:hydroxymethylpyrimidine/phosphomethylpyrimidine kinase